jgi:DNA invertase Pin-like site-specific DNA recombinase
MFHPAGLSVCKDSRVLADSRDTELQMREVIEQGSLIPAVVYAARSKAEEDGKDSTGDQIVAILAQIEHEGGRQIVAEPHVDHASGYTGNRGPGLAAAIEQAAQAASEHGEAELWVWITNRLGRGTGRMEGARAVGKLLYDLREKGITVRSVEDDAFAVNEMLWGVVSQMSSKYSDDLKANVKRGKRARALRGEMHTGILLDGYARLDDGTIVKDPERAHIIELAWAMALEGASVQTIQLEFSRRGFRTAPVRKDHRPRPIDVNRLSQLLNCATYAGIIIYDGEELLGVEGKWPRYIDPEDFHRLRNERGQRCHGTRRKAGRPVQGFLLSELAVCGLCGGPLHAQTHRERKADGGRSRFYVCRAHREHHRDAREWCPAAPFDATTIDCNVLADLQNLICDENGFAEALRAGRQAERERLTQVAAQARDEARNAERAAASADRLLADVLEGDDEHVQQALLNAASLKHAQAQRATTRLEAALDALHAMSEQPAGGAADLALGRLWGALSGRLDAADDVRTVNTALREDFSRFELHHGDGGGFGIVPRLNPDAAVRFDEGHLHVPVNNPQRLRSRRAA